ncbi:MAG: hypothetical protein PHY23_06585 [Oscillospiraceae bacterium]|nr:hypothetical protein [Oscillospiraceae bacterium]
MPLKQYFRSGFHSFQIAFAFSFFEDAPDTLAFFDASLQAFLGS